MIAHPVSAMLSGGRCLCGGKTAHRLTDLAGMSSLVCCRCFSAVMGACTPEEAIERAAGVRFYGGDGTIHHTGRLNVEVDKRGAVVAVWFRCQALPFTWKRVQEPRAAEMRGMYRPGQSDGFNDGVQDLGRGSITSIGIVE